MPQCRSRSCFFPPVPTRARNARAVARSPRFPQLPRLRRCPGICAALALALFLTATLAALALPVPARAVPATPPGAFVDVCSAIVYDLDNDAILFEQNADEPIPPASLTKILSLLLALDHIRDGHARPDSPVLISADAARAAGSRMGLRAGETVALSKLLLGMAVSSGNDASQAVAEYVGGSLPAFVSMMNVRARQLGMNNSLFLNPHGLPAPGQQTTARDMLTLARAYLRAHPGALRLHTTRLLEHGGLTTWNKNPLLGQYPGADGLKTGWIRASGYNLVFTAARDGRRLLAVIMGAPDVRTRGAEACRLLDAGFMVCANQAVSVAAALDTLPLDLARVDVRKTARDAGLLRARPAAWAKAGRYGHYGKGGKVGKYGRARYAQGTRKTRAGSAVRAAAASKTVKAGKNAGASKARQKRHAAAGQKARSRRG